MRLCVIVSVISFLSVVAASSFASVDESISKNQSRWEEFYKELHQHPELSGEEKLTAEKVAREFRSLGLEVKEKIGGYGVVGILRNGRGPTTLVRTELDALPVKEDTGLPYASKVDGKMHACGHDFHAAVLMGTAQAMVENKADWKGTLVFVAQPAEEIVAGASAMIKDGLYKKIPKPDQALALHTIGPMKKGKIGIVSGYAMANVDTVHVTFKGKSTHGSAPEGGIDPFTETAEFTLKMQTLVGREKQAIKAAVISVGSIHGGTKANIIPDEVKMALTVRTFDPEVRKLIKRRIQEIAVGIAHTNNAPDPIVEFSESSDATFNNPQLAERVRKVFQAKFGANAIESPDPIMGAEDFGQFAAAVNAPSLMFWVGEAGQKGAPVYNHSSKYTTDWKATAPLAMKAMTSALLDLHGKEVEVKKD